MSDARTQRPFLAAAWMLGALLCLCGMAIAGREMSVELNAFQITFIRSVFCLAALLLLLRVIGFSRVRSSQKKMHVARNVIHFGGQTGWLYGVAILPLAEVFAIEFTAPIWTAILATVILGERLSRYRMLAIVLGFAGIVIILRPGIAAIQPAALVVLFAAVCFAATYVFTRHMSISESPLTVIFYMNLVQLPMGLVTSLPGWTLPSLRPLALDPAARCHGARHAFLFRPCFPPRRRHRRIATGLHPPAVDRDCRPAVLR